MAYRKFKADQLFIGYGAVSASQVLITTEDGRIEAVLHEGEAGDDVEEFSGLLCPGFVNAHCHLELSHMKGIIPPGTGMVAFLKGVMSQRQFPAEIVQAAIFEAEDQMWNEGIVAVGDICNTTDTIPAKTSGRIFYQNFIETMGFIPAMAARRFEHAKTIYDQFEAAMPGRNAIVPHAPYSVSDDLLKMIAGFPGNQRISLHNQESEAEVQFLQNGSGDMRRLYDFLGIDLSFYQPSGLSSPQWLLQEWPKEKPVIFVHDVHTTASDLRLMKELGRQFNTSNPEADTFLCLCPNANLYIGNGLPDIEMLRMQGVCLLTGTDSLSSNQQLSILEELKTIASHFPKIPLDELLQWATFNGAKALGLQNTFGSFERGSRPGILLLKNTEVDLKNATVQRLL